MAPHLTIGAEDAQIRPALDDVTAERRANDLMADGYCRMVGAIDDTTISSLRRAVAGVRKLGLPPVFVFVFDQTWRIAARMHPLLDRTLLPGYRVLASFWAWHIEPKTEDAGWRPHRDRTVDTIDADGRPRCVTLWTALTDATPDNGCIYILPASRDPAYRKSFKSTLVTDLPDVRALPATAGTVLCWDHALLHWGARSNRRADGPRVSLAFELTRADDPLATPPLLDPRHPPPFEERLALIAKQLLAYQHMHMLSDELEAIAKTLAGVQ